MKQKKHRLKKHVHHHRHKHDKTVSVGRGGLYVPGMNWWGPGFCGVGTCGEMGGGDHEHDEQENQEQNDASGTGGETGESGTITASGDGSAGAM